jgi:diaminopimelate dehydrogenase
VHFVSLEELRRDHSGMPHGGSVIRGGHTGLAGENRHTVEFSLKLDSNPEFTASVLVAYARAIVRMHAEGKIGAVSVFDIPPAMLSPMSREQMLAKML